jgi:hypothetical protein
MQFTVSNWRIFLAVTTFCRHIVCQHVRRVHAVRTAWPTVHGAAPVFDVRLLVAVRLAFLHLGNGGNRLENRVSRLNRKFEIVPNLP